MSDLKQRLRMPSDQLRTTRSASGVRPGGGRRLRVAGLSVLATVLTGPAALAQSEPDPSPIALDEVVVTGSRLSGAQRLSLIETIGPEAMLAAGVTGGARLPSLLTANAGSEWQIDQLNQPQSSGTAQFNLRNLGLGSTLVLVDGQRWTTSAVVSTDGSSFVDINSLIPMIALERIEVVKDGASAVYGSDAVAGVVNFISRRGVERPELHIRHGVADGSQENLIEAIGGRAVGAGDAVFAVSHFHRSALGSDEREFTQARRHGRAAWTAVTSYGQPGSFFRPSMGAYAPDPDCDDPAFASAYRDGPADPFCRLDYSDFFDLAPEETRTQVFADYRAPLGPIEFWLQGAWSSTYTRARQSPSLPILAQSLIIPASHPDNPFGEAVSFRGRLLGAEAGASAGEFDYRTWRLAAGLSGAFASGWRWELTATASRQRVAYDKPDVIGSALQNALNGLGGADCDAETGVPGLGACSFFNPFGSAWLGTGTANAPHMVESLTGSTGLRGISDLATVDAQTSGRVLATDAIVVDLAIGAQVRRSGFRHDWSELVNAGDLLTAGYSPDFDGAQQAAAVFAETRMRLGARVEVQLAARHEHHDGARSALSPKFAVRWDMTDELALRGSWGEGYRAPTVYAQSGAQASQPSVLDRGAFVFVNTLASGNAALQSERSESLSLGVLWRPQPEFEVTIDAWRFDYADLVVKESAQAIIDQAAADDAAGLSGTPAQGRLTRAESGSLTFVQLYFVNAASIHAQGMDVSARYAREVSGGQASLSARWSHVDRYDIGVHSGAPLISGVGSTNLNTLARSLPRNRGELAVSWRGRDHAVTALVHYTSGYRNDRSGIVDPEIASQTTMDVIYSRALKGQAQVSLGVVNLFDTPPPLAQFALGYDPIVADPRGRVASLSISKRF